MVFNYAYNYRNLLFNTNIGDGFRHAVIILQHPSIYTLGRNASTKHLKFNPAEESVS